MHSLGKFKVNPAISPLRKRLSNYHSWFDRLTTNGEKTVRPEPVEGRGLSGPLSCWIGTNGGLRGGLSLGVALLLLLAVACGAAATATPAPTAAPAPRPAAAQPPAPPAPVVAATPTATPKPTPAPVAAATKVHPGKVTWMVSSWESSRFTYNYSSGAGNNYLRILHGHLITTNEKSESLPGIATRWEISKDGKVWTVTIRDGAKFHDGKEITAEDVWWSWMHYWGKDQSGSAVERTTQSTAQSLAHIVDKIELTRRDQVSITTKIADASFAGSTLAEAGPSAAGVVPKRPKVHDDTQDEAYAKNPIGAGPMKLVRHVPSEVMAFERFDDFYYQPKNGLPEDRRLKFKSLDLRLVPEEATRVAAIRAGEADIAPVSLQAKRQVEAGGGHIVFGPEGIVFRPVWLRCWKTQFPCHDKRVRQALAYAIDKELMRDRLYGGPEVMQVKGWTGVTPSGIGYSVELDPFPFDPVKARQLLADAGYPGGKEFGKLIVNTYVSRGIPLMVESAQLAAEFWKRELGLDVEIKVGEETNITKQKLSGSLDGLLVWEDATARKDYASNIKSKYGTPGAPARLHESQELFDLTQNALGVIDPEERAVALNILYRRLRDEHYDMSIGYVNIPWAVGPRVLTWTPYPLASYPTNLHGIILK